MPKWVPGVNICPTKFWNSLTPNYGAFWNRLACSIRKSKTVYQKHSCHGRGELQECEAVRGGQVKMPSLWTSYTNDYKGYDPKLWKFWNYKLLFIHPWWVLKLTTTATMVGGPKGLLKFWRAKFIRKWKSRTSAFKKVLNWGLGPHLHKRFQGGICQVFTCACYWNVSY